jgi:hypothetical protein
MFIYKYLKIDDHKRISTLIKNYIETTTTVLEEQLHWKFLNVDPLLEQVPEIKSVFEYWNLRIITAAVIYRNPYSQGGIHIDSSNYYRVLWPVSNCDRSYTKFFEEEPSKFIPGSGKDGDKNLSLIPGQSLKFLDQFELTEPVLFNPKIPHGVYCDPFCDQPRISITFGFDRNPKDII